MNDLRLNVVGILPLLQSSAASALVKDSVSILERLCVACLGHSIMWVKEDATRVLNSLYDGVDWQVVSCWCH